MRRQRGYSVRPSICSDYKNSLRNKNDPQPRAMDQPIMATPIAQRYVNLKSREPQVLARADGGRTGIISDWLLITLGSR